MRAPASIPPDFGAPSSERTISPASHAFGASEKEAPGTLLVHFKVLSTSADERLAIARIVEAQLKGQRVGSKDLTFLITGDEVESGLMDLGPLEAKVSANILKRLGIR
jgi:hypothetical protein